MKAFRQIEARAAHIVGDSRWRSLLERDPSADGEFVYGVKTTGVYCRPSCTSRLPRPENVIFYASADRARLAGLRACRRCKPNELVLRTLHAKKIAAAAIRARRKEGDIRFAIGKCWLGSFLVGKSERGVCAILLGTDPKALSRDLQARFPKENLIDDGRGLETLVARVAGLVDAPASGHDLRLDMRGTAFQRRVWRALRKIKPGETASYADVAMRIGSPRAVRAVAQACAANALAVAIPCHRVVRNDGRLSGYRWGVERKRRLLEEEACA